MITNAEKEQMTFEDIQNLSDEEFQEYVGDGILDDVSPVHDSSSQTPNKNSSSQTHHEINDESDDPDQSSEEVDGDDEGGLGESDEHESSEDDGQISEDDSADADNEEELGSSDEDDDDEDKNADNGDKPSKTDDISSALEPIVVKGKKKKIRSIEHLRALAQQGYLASSTLNKVKPHMRAITALEEGGLLGTPEAEHKLSLVIDAAKGVPEAIRELSNMHDIDLAEIALDENDGSAKYTPKTKLPSESEVELKEVLDSIKATPSYDTLINVVGGMDSGSKNEILKEPTMLEALNHDIHHGIYDDIVEEIEYRKLVGSIGKNEPFIDSYRTVAIELANKTAPQVESHSKIGKTKTVKRKQSPKKSMSNPRRASGAKSLKSIKDINTVINMSDEEFEKFLKETS